MPICITCSTPVKNLYTTYSRADDRSLGKGVRLTQCPNCKRFADKYVEHDYVVLFIDLVLIKPQVYRHLLFNRLYTPTNTLDPSILRLGILLILFDVYITWARIERSNSPSNLPTTPTSTSSWLFSPSSGPDGGLSHAPIITQYLFFLTLNVVATVVQHGVVRFLARVFARERERGGSEVDESGDGREGGFWAVLGSPRSFLTQQQQRNGSASANVNGNGLHHVRSHSSPSKFVSVSTATTAAEDNGSTVNVVNGNSASSVSHSAGNSTSVNAANQPTIHQSPHSPRDPSPQRDHKPTTSTYIHPHSQSQSHHAQASPSAISTALLVSSCTKLFPILLVIWPTTTATTNNSPSTSLLSPSSSLAPFAHRATSYIGWIVLLNNIEALLILLDCSYMVATTLAVAGLLSRWIVEGWLLSIVGLVRELEGPIGDVIALWGWIVGGIV